MPPARLGALAAVAAGLCWVAKASAILAFGATRLDGALLVLGQLFLAVALVALAIVLGLRGADARLGLAASAVAFVLSLVNLGLELAAATTLALAEGAALTYAGAALALLVALVALGIVARREMRGSPWANAPLALGLSFIPLLALGGALALVHPRLLEVPVLMLGFGFLALAGTLRAAADARAA